LSLSQDATIKNIIKGNPLEAVSPANDRERQQLAGGKL
jgi:hypothetical protein